MLSTGAGYRITNPFHHERVRYATTQLITIHAMVRSAHSVVSWSIPSYPNFKDFDAIVRLSKKGALFEIRIRSIYLGIRPFWNTDRFGQLLLVAQSHDLGRYTLKVAP